MLTPTEACLESKAERIARIITREYNLQVRIEGSGAYFDFKTRSIVIPNLTRSEQEGLSEVLDGFLDHECSHGVFSDSEVVSEIRLEQGTPEHTMWNAVEDSWVERAMARRFIGAGQNIAKLNVEISKSIRAKWDKMDAFNRLVFALLRVWANTATLDDFVDDEQIGKILPLLTGEIQDGYRVSSTREAYELSQRILAKIKDLADQARKSKPRKSEEASESDDRGKPQGASEADEGDEEGGQEQGEGEEDGDDLGDAGQPGDGDDDEDSENQDRGKEGEGNDAEDDEEDEEDDGEEGDGDDGGDAEDVENGETDGEPEVGDGEDEGGGEQAAQLQDLIDSGECQDSKTDVENFINESIDKIRSEETGDEPEDYLVFTEEFDKDIEYSTNDRQSHSEQYSKLRSQVADYVGPMATALTLALAAETETRWIGGARRGRRFDRRAVSQWFLGKDDDRLWRQREQNDDWDTAVALLWDCSGSMRRSSDPGSKSALARLAAIAFHESLCTAHIAHEVLGFNTGGGVPDGLRDRVQQAKRSGDDLKRFSRLAQTDKRMVFVPFGSMDGRALCFIDGNYANRDGECVLWAAKRLAARPERRKVLIVGSDGLPSGAIYDYTEQKYLQTVVRDIITSGIETFGLGIMDESVKHYYPEWALIRRAADIPAVVLGVLSKILLRRGTQNVRFPKLRQRASGGGCT